MIRLPGPGPEWLALEESTNIWSLYNPLINQDLSYDESLSGQPGAFLYACNHKISGYFLGIFWVISG